MNIKNHCKNEHSNILGFISSSFFKLSSFLCQKLGTKIWHKMCFKVKPIGKIYSHWIICRKKKSIRTISINVPFIFLAGCLSQTIKCQCVLQGCTNLRNGVYNKQELGQFFSFSINHCTTHFASWTALSKNTGNLYIHFAFLKNDIKMKTLL